MGARNTPLTSLAGNLRRAGASLESLEAELTRANLERCDPPLERAEVAKIAASVASYARAPACRPRRADLVAHIGRILERLRRARWKGIAGQTRRKVVVAVCNIANDAGSAIFTASERQIGERAGVGRAAVRGHLRRLEEDRWLRCVVQGHGRAGSRWQLMLCNIVPLNSHQPQYIVRKTPVLVGRSCTATDSDDKVSPGLSALEASPTEIIRHDVLRWRSGLGGTAWQIVEQLKLGQPMTKSNLQAAIGCHRTTLQRKLRRMDAVGLIVECEAGKWALTDMSLDDAALALERLSNRPCRGAGARQRARHQRERARYQQSEAVRTGPRMPPDVQLRVDEWLTMPVRDEDAPPWADRSSSDPNSLVATTARNREEGPLV